MEDIIKKNFDNPDESSAFPKLTVESIHFGEFSGNRMIFEPGWRWSDALPEYLGTDTCQDYHPIWMVLSGKFAIQMDNSGNIEEFGPGDIMIPAGHDAWVVGDQPVVGIEFQAKNGTSQS